MCWKDQEGHYKSIIPNIFVKLFSWWGSLAHKKCEPGLIDYFFLLVCFCLECFDGEYDVFSISPIWRMSSLRGTSSEDLKSPKIHDLNLLWITIWSPLLLHQQISIPSKSRFCSSQWMSAQKRRLAHRRYRLVTRLEWVFLRAGTTSTTTSSSTSSTIAAKYYLLSSPSKDGTTTSMLSIETATQSLTGGEDGQH